MPDWGLGAVPNFGQALFGGYQAGRQIRQQQRQDEKIQRTEQVLRGFTADPDGSIAMADQFDPELGQNLRQRRAQTLMGEQYASTATTPQAAQIARLDPDMYAKFDDRQREHMKKAADFFGQRALQIARLPANQRAQAWDQAIDGASELGMDLSQQRGKYSDQALLNVVAQADEMKAFLEAQEPKRVPVEAGGTVYEQPGAVDPNFGRVTPNVVTPVQPVGVPVQAEPARVEQAESKLVRRDQARELVRQLGQDGFDRWLKKYGLRVEGDNPSQTPVQSKVLSNGQTAYLVNGAWYDNPEGR